MDGRRLSDAEIDEQRGRDRGPTADDGAPVLDGLVRGVNHVSVFVDELDDAQRFLTEVLRFRLERTVDDPHSGTLLFFRSGSAMVELVRLHDDERRRERLGGAAAVIDHIAFDVNDADTAAESLTAAGVRLREPFRATSDGRSAGRVRASHRRKQARVFFTDPTTSAGVVFQFVQED